MTEINREHEAGSEQIEQERSGTPFLNDEDMTEQMSDRQGNTRTLLRYMAISFAIGTLVFIALAYGLHYFQMHYGASFFDHT